LLRELAQAYERGDARVGERCVSVQILEKASGDAEQALARGWEETSDGPRPDVWSPASTAWTVLLREHRSARDAGGLVPQARPTSAERRSRTCPRSRSRRSRSGTTTRDRTARARPFRWPRSLRRKGRSSRTTPMWC